MKKPGSEGLGLGANVNVNLKVGELKGILDMLGNALNQTGEKAKSMIAEAVGKLREAGAQKLKQASQKEGGRGEATDAYNKTLSQLQTASERGDAEATELLKEMKA